MAVLSSFLIVAFLAGVVGALQIPTLSLFLSVELKAESAAIGVFYAINAGIGIGVSFWLAALSDRLCIRRRLLIFCYIMAVCNSLIFAYSRDYLVLLIVGSFLAAVANTATPQLFALAREYNASPTFNALMRAQLSLAWIIGPPLAFNITAAAGFKMMYLLSAAVFAPILLLTMMLPANRKVAIRPKVLTDIRSNGMPDIKVGLLFVTSVLMWSCSALYLIDMPLFVSQRLGLPEQSIGLIMGVAAAVEIPVMLLAGRYVERLGKKQMLSWSLYAGMIFYSVLPFATSLWQLLFLQLINALFIGIIATVGMFFFQALLPDKQGVATTFFTNSVSVGIIFAGVLHVLLTKNGKHEYVYIIAAILLLTARFILRKVQEK